MRRMGKLALRPQRPALQARVQRQHGPQRCVETVSSTLSRVALNRHVGNVVAVLVRAEALGAQRDASLQLIAPQDRDTANEINADMRTYGPAKALVTVLDESASPKLHDEFEKWLRRFASACARLSSRSQPADASLPPSAIDRRVTLSAPRPLSLRAVRLYSDCIDRHLRSGSVGHSTGADRGQARIASVSRAQAHGRRPAAAHGRALARPVARPGLATREGVRL